MRQSLRVLVVLAGCIVAGDRAARAEHLEALKARIPFAFKAGSAVLPAGEYELRFDEGFSSGVLFIRNQDGHQTAIVLTEKTDDRRGHHGEPSLLFDSDGSLHVLAAVEYPGDGFDARIVVGVRELKGESGELPSDRPPVAGLRRTGRNSGSRARPSHLRIRHRTAAEDTAGSSPPTAWASPTGSPEA